MNFSGKRFRASIVSFPLAAFLFSGTLAFAKNHTQETETKTNQKVEAQLIEDCPMQKSTSKTLNVENKALPIPIDDCDNDGGGGGGPYVAPRTPKDIDYAAYTHGSNKIQWGESYGYGFPVNYRVEEKKNSGSWVQIYSGYGRSRILNNKPNGNYSYRVRGCNAKGCSAYKTGLVMKIQTLSKKNYSAIYPGLEASRSNDSNFIQTNTRFYDVTRGNTSSTARTSSTQATSFPHNLGKGFSLTEGSYAPEEVCLNPSDLYVNSTNKNKDTLNYYEIQTSEELYKKLDLDISADLSLSIGKFGQQSDGKYELFRESKMKQDYSKILVKWERQAKRLDLQSSTPRKLKNYWVNNYLNPTDGSTVSERDFRNQCGDKYIKSIVTGARLYVLLEINDVNASSQEMSTISYNAKIKIAQVFNASSSGTISNETKQFFSKHSIKLRVVAEGGSTVNQSVEDVDLVNIRAYMDNFIASVKPSGYIAVDKELSYYPIPLKYNHLTYFQVFKDYRPIQTRLTRWIALDNQLHGRCEALFNVDAQINANKYKNRCHNASKNLGEQSTACAFGEEWPDCKNPASTNYPTDFFNTIPSVYAVGSPEYTTSLIPYFSVSNCGAFCGGRSGTRTAKACLPSNECLVNTSKRHTDANSLPGNTAPAGAYVYVDNLKSPGGGGASHTITPEPNGTQCLKSSVTIKSKGWWGSNASYEGSQVILGRCPVNEPFELP